MMKQVLSVCLVAGLTAACARAADVENMVVKTPSGDATPASLRAAIHVAHVGGGENTDPLIMSKVGTAGFRSALERSLTANAMRAPNAASARYHLDARLVGLRQPAIGLDMTVTAAVFYVMKTASGGKTVYKEVIETPYTAELSRTPIGMQRLRFANEGAIRTNIATFISELKKKADQLK